MAIIKTYGEQLAEVQEAITSVMSGQMYNINGRQVQKADLEWLHKRELYLTKQLELNGDVAVGSSSNRGAYNVEFN